MDDNSLRDLLRFASEALSTPDFCSWHASFVNAHCDAFDVGDENSLECSYIHQQYEAAAEARLEAALPGSSLRDLSDAIAGLARTPRDLLADQDAAEAIDKLISLTDYATFKEVMLAAKAERHAHTPWQGHATLAAVPVDISAGEDVRRFAAQGLAIRDDGMEDSVYGIWDEDLFVSLPELTEPPSAANGWTRTLETRELISERKITADGALLMRVTFSAADLSVEQGARMMVDWTQERTHWDGMLKASRTHSEERDEAGLISDLVYTQTMKIPFLARLGGIPCDFGMRIRSRRDWPEAGNISWALTPWDVAAGTVDRQNKYMTGGMGVAKPSPSGGVVVTLFEKNAVRWIPSFLMNRMIKGQVLGNLQRYRAHLGMS